VPETQWGCFLPTGEKSRQGPVPLPGIFFKFSVQNGSFFVKKIFAFRQKGRGTAQAPPPINTPLAALLSHAIFARVRKKQLTAVEYLAGV